MQITKVEVIQVEQKFATITQAMKYFGFENKSRRTFGRYVSEFTNHKDFKHGYINPTGHFPLIDLKLFEAFLRWKDATKFKPK